MTLISILFAILILFVIFGFLFYVGEKQIFKFSKHTMQYIKVFNAVGIILTLFFIAIETSIKNRESVRNNKTLFTNSIREVHTSINDYFLKYGDKLDNLLYSIYGKFGYIRHPHFRETIETKNTELFVIIKMIELMQDTFNLLGFDENKLKDKSLQGVITTFKIWTQSPIIIKEWNKTKILYEPEFVEFMDKFFFIK